MIHNHGSKKKSSKTRFWCIARALKFLGEKKFKEPTTEPPVSSLLVLPWKALGSFRLLEKPGTGDSWILFFFKEPEVL
jgi:hypothetical protein